MEIIRSIVPKLLSVVEVVINNLSGGQDFARFQDELANKLNEVGREITREVLEEMDRQIKEDKTRRREWQVWRRGDTKEIVTRFGVVTYKRTYYRHKETKQYAYLVDEQAGYTPHLRIDHNVKAELVACAAELSYRKSGQAIGERCGNVAISGQTVKTAVDTFERVAVENKTPKKRVKRLYIEADEDHVACQHGRSFEARLVYIHEGWDASGKRRKVERPIYQSSVDEEIHTFWERVWEEADKLYDLERVEKIYLIGDGAAWIQIAKEVFPQAEFILDRFHYMKHIRMAVGGAHKQGQILENAIRFNNFEKAQEIIRELIKAAVNPGRKQSILDAWKYIKNNWAAITALYREGKSITCSGEGHISHILSARLSSRPMAWSKNGARHMSYVRVARANGQSIAEEYIKQRQSQPLPVISINQEKLEKERKKLKETREVLDNIPILNGPKNYLWEALKALSLA